MTTFKVALSFCTFLFFLFFASLLDFWLSVVLSVIIYSLSVIYYDKNIFNKK